ncbi:MAG TPA: hypothetical protein PLQ47_01840, partial [Candidatus Marinimicrobia bacterium]|nr:hypothetical protein [Candidatus Neomarinimicrobiota bacterium]
MNPKILREITVRKKQKYKIRKYFLFSFTSLSELSGLILYHKDSKKRSSLRKEKQKRKGMAWLKLPSGDLG